MICDNVLEYIGHTPIVRLNRMNDPYTAERYFSTPLFEGD